MIAVWGRYTKGQIVEIASLKKKEEERGIFRRSERPSRLEAHDP